nr:cyclin-dependent kinase C [Tanacetum cinerariifolium]
MQSFSRCLHVAMTSESMVRIKFPTVAIDVLIWDTHACPFGLCGLLVTIAGVSSPSPQQGPAASKLMDYKDEKSHTPRNVKEVSQIMLLLCGIGLWNCYLKLHYMVHPLTCG